MAVIMNLLFHKNFVSFQKTFKTSIFCLFLCLFSSTLIGQDGYESFDKDLDKTYRVLFLNVSEVTWPYTLAMFSACHQEVSKLLGHNVVMLMDSIVPSKIQSLDMSNVRDTDCLFVSSFGTNNIDFCIVWDPQGVATSLCSVINEIPMMVLQPYGGISESDLDCLPLNLYVRSMQLDAVKMLNAIERCDPDINKVIVVAGNGYLDKLVEGQVRSQLGSNIFDFDIEYWSDKTIEEIFEDSSRLPENCSIYYLSFNKDISGKEFVPRDVMEKLSLFSSVPVFGFVGTYFDNGMVGGYVDSPFITGKKVARDLAFFLSGYGLDRFGLVGDCGEYVFDWNQLNKWGLSTQDFERDVLILNHPVSILELHPELIWVGFVLLVLMFCFIVYLRLSRRIIRQALEHERKSKQLENRYHALFENMPSGFGLLKNVYNDNGDICNYEILEANPSMLKATGLDFKDINGKLLFDLLKDIQTEWKNFFLRAASCVEPLFYEAYSPIFNRYYLASAFCPVKDHLALLLLDISERKQALIDLEESKAFLRTVIDTVPIKIFWKDKKSIFLGCNNAVIKDSCFDSPEEVCGKTDYDMPWTKEESDAFRADDKEVIETGIPKLNMAECQHQSDGKLHWLITNKLPLRNSKGECIGVLGTADDITEEKGRIDELQRLSTAIEHSPDAIVITDVDGIAEYVNPAFETITCYNKEEILGNNMSMVASGSHDNSFYMDFWNTISSGNIWKGHIINRRKDGNLYTERASIAPVTDNNGQIINYVAVKRDITQELVHEERLKEVQKMEAVGQLAGGIAHDFNNTLQAILGFCDLLLVDCDNSTPQFADLMEIQKATQHASTLTGQLLDFSRKTPSRTENFDVNHLIEDAMPMIRSVVGEAIEVTVNAEPNLWFIRGDRDQIERVLVNLSINARDAMTFGGKLIVSTANIIFDCDNVLNVPEAAEGKFVCISIEDNGEGISEDVKRHIFEPFFSTKELGKGTGLGLASVYGIMQEHNGWICVESEVDEGTKFEIYIPACDRAE